MLNKLQIEEIIRNDLKKVMSNRRIYKYSSLEIGLDKILIEKTLNFSHPSVFNDPFDCNEKLLKIKLTEEELKTLFNKFKVNVPKSYWNTLWKEMNDPKKVEEFNKNQRVEYKISCFSTNYKEVLMWSHYAQKHSGMCIGFDFPFIYPEKFVLAPVKYVPELRALDGNTSLSRVILYWLTTKSERWKYEEEIRAIARTSNTEKTELIEFEPKYVTEIIFGCNIDQNKIDQGIKKIKNSDLDFDKLMIKRMVIDTNTFLLKEELIKPST